MLFQIWNLGLSNASWADIVSIYWCIQKIEKSAFNCKGNKFLDIHGEKIKNQEHKKSANIFKNKVVFFLEIVLF